MSGPMDNEHVRDGQTQPLGPESASEPGSESASDSMEASSLGEDGTAVRETVAGDPQSDWLADTGPKYPSEPRRLGWQPPVGLTPPRPQPSGWPAPPNAAPPAQ